MALRTRRVCREKGHKFRDSSGVMALPVIFCVRWFCDGAAVAAWCPPDIAVNLHNAIPPEVRYPPEEIAT